MTSIFEKGEIAYYKLMFHLKMAMYMRRGGTTSRVISKEDIIHEARDLSNDYMDDRLIRSGLNLKQRKITPAPTHFAATDAFLSNRLNISVQVKSEKAASLEAMQIMAEKRHSPDGCQLTIDDLSKVLVYIGEALEVRHPLVYTDVLQQLNIRSLGEVNLRRIFMNVAKELFSEGINWPKIVSFFAFAGGLAVDCVLNGSSVYVTRIKNWSVEYIESDLADWIMVQGGWIGLFDHFTAQHQPSPASNLVWTISAVVLLVAVIVAAVLAYSLRTF